MSEPFWHDGLRFQCTRCSACCRYEPGVVLLSASDIRRLMSHFGLAFHDFMAKFTRTIDVGTGLSISLKEKPNNDCILWGAEGCSAYGARPTQCSTYPFWQSILESSERWEDEASSCPGIGRGDVHGAAAIGEAIVARRSNPAIVIDYDLSLEQLDENTILGS